MEKYTVWFFDKNSNLQNIQVEKSMLDSAIGMINAMGLVLEGYYVCV